MKRVPAGYSRATLLGTGRSGRVWRARQDDIGRFVALKEVPCRTAAEKDALRREAAAMGAGDLACLPRLHGVEIEGGRGWIVQEYVHGVSVGALRNLGLDASEAQALAHAAVGVVAALHASGRSHGDLDPGHLILEPSGRMRTIDLGFSSARTESVRGGSSGYMPDEAGKSGADPLAAEIWGLGVLLHEILCGARPGPRGPDTEALARHGRWSEAVSACLCSTPMARPRAAALLAFVGDPPGFPPGLLERVGTLADVELARRLSGAGREALQKGDGRAAWDLLQEAATLDPDDTETLDLLARVRIGPPHRRVIPWIAAGLAAVLVAGVAFWRTGWRDDRLPVVPMPHRSVDDRLAPAAEAAPLPLRDSR